MIAFMTFSTQPEPHTQMNMFLFQCTYLGQSVSLLWSNYNEDTG